MSIFTQPQKCLYPLGICYGAITAARNWLYDRNIYQSNRPDVPVICVGNVVVGGSGKSPFCDYLAEKLILRGKRPVILTRGYGGSVKGPYLVKACDPAAVVGDEAVMHCRLLGERGQVVIGADRVDAIQFIEGNKLGDIVIMDDGLQHRRLSPHFAVLMLDVSHPQRVTDINNGLLLPAGYLRESKKEALKKANVVVLVKKGSNWVEGELEEIKRTLEIDKSCFAVQMAPKYFRDLYSGERIELTYFTRREIVIVSALADPSSFKLSLAEIGIKPIRQWSFPDHHQYTLKEWNSFQTQSTSIITTVKDGVKLKPFVSRAGEIFELVSSMKFILESAEDDFWKQLEGGTVCKNR